MEALLRALAAALSLPLTPTISVAVALWLLFGLIAARFNVAGWWRRRLILERATALDRPEREIELARQRHEAELVASVVQLAFLSIGIVIASAPPAVPPFEPVPWQSLVIVPVLVLVQIAMAVESWRQNRYDRRRVLLPPVSHEQQIAEGDHHHDA